MNDQLLSGDSSATSHNGKKNKPMLPRIPSEKKTKVSEDSQTFTGGPISSWPTHPIEVRCLSCNQKGMTQTKRRLSKIGIVLFILLMPTIVFCFLILCLNSMYITEHYCPHCDKLYGSSSK